MVATSRWLSILAAGLLAMCPACGDDEGTEGGGGAGGEASSTGAPASSGDATSSSGSSGSTTSSTSMGGPDVCPEAPPQGGECAVGGVCHYEEEGVCEDGSILAATVDATCIDGTWVIDIAYSGQCCPFVPLQSGFDLCSVEGKVCNYEGDVVCEDGGATSGNVVATCDGSTWQTAYEPTGATCEGETVCPAEPPNEGSACDLAVQSRGCIWERASTCPDGQGYDVVTVANCRGATGTWSVATFFQGTECPTCAEQELSCETEGLACVTEQEVAEIEWCGGAGVMVTGSLCEDGAPQTSWDLPICAGSEN